jgi:hypothetical protein
MILSSDLEMCERSNHISIVVYFLGEAEKEQKVLVKTAGLYAAIQTLNFSI